MGRGKQNDYHNEIGKYILNGEVSLRNLAIRLSKKAGRCVELLTTGHTAIRRRTSSKISNGAVFSMKTAPFFVRNIFVL